VNKVTYCFVKVIHFAESVHEGVDGIEEKCLDCHPADKQTAEAYLVGDDGMDG
jgi:hypothetical protein